MSKPKTNYKPAPGKLASKDLFQTPSYALTPLLRYIRQYDVVWEPACGEGYLNRALRRTDKQTIPGDLQLGNNYFDGEIPLGAQIQITNVPFSHKYLWLDLAISQGLPFALLMPSDVLFAETYRRFARRYGLQQLSPNERFKFKTPLKGWVSSPQMHCSWVCWQLDLPSRLTECDVEFAEEEELSDEDRICPPQRELALALIKEEDARRTEQAAKKASRKARIPACNVLSSPHHAAP